MYRIILMLTLGLLCTAGQASNSTLVFESEQQRVNLLELYTSEGCSSCPPAEAWLATLLDHPQLWEQLVPVVFHVDYWNQLGWEDPFSNSGNRAGRSPCSGCLGNEARTAATTTGYRWLVTLGP